MVEYLGWETTYTEIVPSDRLRTKSQEPSITASTFTKFQLPVPQELRDFCVDEKVTSSLKSPFIMTFSYCKAADIHTEFMKAVDACHVRFDAAKVWIQ